MEEKKDHLWIPEREVENVEKTPAGRSAQSNLDHGAHGQTLSQGLQSIVDYTRHLQSAGVLDERDPVVLQVILQEREDISVRRRFLENEGLTIHAVKDGQHVIVSAPRDVFGRLQERVLRYRDKGTKKSFRNIQGFAPFTAEDKMAASIRRYTSENPDAASIDVQIMLLPHMRSDVQERALASVAERIRKKNGALQGDPYQLTNGTVMIRAIMPPGERNEIAADPRIYRVEKTAFFKASSQVT